MIGSEVYSADALCSFGFRLEYDDVRWVGCVQVADRVCSGIQFGSLFAVEYWCAAKLSEYEKLGHVWGLFVPDCGGGFSGTVMHYMIVLECCVTYSVFPVGRW